MTDTIVIGVCAILAITIMVLAGVATGHDGALLTGGIATVSGLAASFGAYKAAATQYPKWRQKRIDKELANKENGGKNE